MELIQYVENHGVYFYLIVLWMAFAAQAMVKGSDKKTVRQATRTVFLAWHLLVTIAAIMKVFI